jgi:hypothetical protein
MLDYLSSCKKSSPKYLRLPYLIFNDIDLIAPINTGKESAHKATELGRGKQITEVSNRIKLEMSS